MIAKSNRRVAFVATGSTTHRLDRPDPSNPGPWAEAERIEREIVDLILARRYDDLAGFDPDRWSTVAPEGNIGPLFMVAGAIVRSFTPRRVFAEQMFGSVSPTTIEFVPE